MSAGVASQPGLPWATLLPPKMTVIKMPKEELTAACLQATCGVFALSFTLLFEGDYYCCIWNTCLL